MSESVQAGITIPYSPEFGEMESKPELLAKLADMTGGKVYAEDDDVLQRLAESGELYRPVVTNQRTLQPLWFMLVLLTGIGMFLDVAVRRISIEPAVVSAKLSRLWASLRGRQAAEAPADPFIERLKSRKAKVEETLAKDRPPRHFESKSEGEDLPPPPDASAGPAPPRDPKPKPPTPAAPAEPGDFASRLMRAKKRAQEDRDKR